MLQTCQKCRRIFEVSTTRSSQRCDECSGEISDGAGDEDEDRETFLDDPPTVPKIRVPPDGGSKP